jgi:hypothetical protein
MLLIGTELILRRILAFWPLVSSRSRQVNPPAPSPKTPTVALHGPAALIVTVRRHRVIFDADLAALYGVSTKALNQAVKRNAKRFPENFAFQVSTDEWEAMRSQNVTASKRNVRYQPLVFTEHGALMAANVPLL